MKVDMLRTRRFVVELLATLFVLAVIGNVAHAQWSWEEASEPYRGTKLTLVTVAWPDAIVELVAEFTDKTGIAVEVTRLAHGPLYESIAIDLRSRTGSYDLFTVSSAWLPGFAEPGLLEPIDSLLESPLVAPDYDAQDHLGFEGLAGYQGDIYGLPFGVSTQALFYRTDLFEAHGAAFEAEFGYPLTPPATWQEYNDIARYFTEAEWYSPAGDRGYGVAEHGKREHSLMYIFQIRLSGVINDAEGRSVGLLNDQEEPAFDNEYGVLALTQWIEALQYAPPGVLEAGNVETKELFAQGMTAMTAQFSSLFGPLFESPVADDFGVALMPGGKPTTGAWLLVTNPHGRAPEAAFLLAQWLTTRDADLAMFNLAGRYPSRSFTHASPVYREANPFWEVEVQSKEVGVPQLPHPAFPRLEALLMEEIHRALIGEKDAETAIRDLSASWRAHLADR